MFNQAVLPYSPNCGKRSSFYANIGEWFVFFDIFQYENRLIMQFNKPRGCYV